MAGGKRWYTWQHGASTERYWRVTTIIGGGVPKPALIGWAAKITATTAIEDLSIVAAMIGRDKLPDGSLPPMGDDGKPTTKGCQAAYDHLTKARFRSAGKAADLGTEVHEAIEAWVLDKPLPKWSPEAEPFMEAFVGFLDDFDPVFEVNEASVYNRTQKYAGTLDGIARFSKDRIAWEFVDLDLFPTIDEPRDVTLLLDTKTGTGVYPEVALQMAAYANAEFIGLPDGSEEPMLGVDGACVIHLRPEGYSLVPVAIHPFTIEAQGAPFVIDAFKSFQYAREVFRWMEEGSKYVIGQPLHPGAKAVA